MNWEQVIDTVRPHVVRIETPTGWGTGFLAFYNHDNSWCGIATAAHVVNYADEWQQPIRVRSDTAGLQFLKNEERVIFIDQATDSAVVLFLKGEFKLPEVPISLVPPAASGRIGIDVGWLGFPNIEPHTLCFFAGTVSALQESSNAYLIDGVAINGVSGGPVFHCPNPNGEPQIIGCVSAYHANRATGEALPGLLRAQDVSHFRGVAERIKNIDEANAQKREFDEAQKAKLNTDGGGDGPILVGEDS